MKYLDGGVTSPKGFKAANIAAGIKYAGRDDMAMVVSEVPCVSAATFTTNVVKAAPVVFDKKLVDEAAPLQAVVINAGIANACTGKEGFECCELTAKAAAKTLDIPENAVAVASTGVIGFKIPVDKISAGVENMKPLLSDTREAGHKAACAIMTTDTVSKEVAVEVEIGGKTVTIGAMCKGSGMIHPNMCTMLGFTMTDVAIEKAVLQEMLSDIVKDTYNMVSVDGDTSTNDTLMVLANGLADNPVISGPGTDYDVFKEALFAVHEKIAKMMAADGEGATHLYEVIVENAKNKDEAVILAKSVVGSSLCKAAIYGKDANCGRFMCALGYSGVQFDPDTVDVFFESQAGSVKVVEDGMALSFDEDFAVKVLSEDEVTVRCDMKAGKAKATAWGCDLTHEYVNINADYRS